MAKDFFQDILPNEEPRPTKRERLQGDEVEVPSDNDLDVGLPQVPERSIRNINVNRPRPMERMTERPSERIQPADRRETPSVAAGIPKLPKRRPTIWLWGLTVLLVLIIGSLILFLFRSTTISVVPRAQTVVFDSANSFTAYPVASAPTGSLTYTLRSFELEDSQPVAASGTTHAEHKATGSVTIVNEYSSTPVKLVKTTRFQTPDGLIFRVPADVSVPGMKGTAPGTVTVTLVADQAGEKYNIGPMPRFTLPGLKGGAMYEKVYARSTGNFSGGFQGEEPNVETGTRTAALSEMQGRLRDKIVTELSNAASDTTVFPLFSAVVFEELPATAQEEGKVSLRLRARVQVPVFPSSELNARIASGVSADAETAKISLLPKDGFGANLLNATSTTYGSTPVRFTLSGTAQLVWDVDAAALSQALAGKDESAFQTVVNGFPGIQEARARIEPFWRKTFPTDAQKINVVVLEPKEATTP